MSGVRNFVLGVFTGGLAVWFLMAHPQAVDEGWRAARDWLRTETSAAREAARDAARDAGRATEDAAGKARDALERTAADR